MELLMSGPTSVTFRTGHMGYTFRFFGREVWMPWKASSVMEERLRFVARLLDGEAMTEVCREFGVSRKTGYKIYDRYGSTAWRPSATARGARCAMPQLRSGSRA